MKRYLLVVLFSALIGVGAWAELSIGPVPISLQTLFLMLAGFSLGPLFGGLSVLFYLLAGLMGAPVFAGGTAGLEHLAGPTGGYLVGFVPAAVVAGLAPERSGELSWGRGFLWGGVAHLPLYGLGLLQLGLSLELGWVGVLEQGMLHQLPGTLIKLALAVLIYRLAHARRLLGRRTH